MRAIVSVKRVVDYAVKVRVAADKKGVDLQNVKMSMNPFCEIAVEEGIRMKEKGHVKELIVVSCGAAKTAETLRQALALGADRAIHINTGTIRTDQELQPLAVAKILQKIIEKEQPDIFIAGKQSIDGDQGQTGAILAGLLGWPQATNASEVTVSDDKKSVAVTREIDDGIQKLKLSLPAILTCDLRLNEPRFATLPNLMKAKKKKMEVIEVDSLGVDITPRYEVLQVVDPPPRAAGKMVGSVDELLAALRDDAKVI